jgi:hypothetical protein
MRRKLLPALGALILATNLTSCYVYDDPLTWGAPCSTPVYRLGYYPSPALYPTHNFGYSSYRLHSHCAPTPPMCHGGFGHDHHDWH